MRELVVQADKANGFVFSTLKGNNPYPAEVMYGVAENLHGREIWSSFQEKYITEDDKVGNGMDDEDQDEEEEDQNVLLTRNVTERKGRR